MASLLMGVITLNAIRVISGVSSSLSSMGNVGLILGIIIFVVGLLILRINSQFPKS